MQKALESLGVSFVFILGCQIVLPCFGSIFALVCCGGFLMINPPEGAVC